MPAFWKDSIKMKHALFTYWLVVPVLFSLYLVVYASVKHSSITALLTNMPSLALTSILALLSFFQVFVLYKLKNFSKYRHSLFGTFLKFSIIQQVISLNIIGLILCIFAYRSLFEGQAQEHIPSQTKIQIYSFMGLIAFLTLIVAAIRISL